MQYFMVVIDNLISIKAYYKNDKLYNTIILFRLFKATSVYLSSGFSTKKCIAGSIAYIPFPTQKTFCLDNVAY